MSIQKINAGDEGSQSHNLVEDNISKLKALFPEIMTEGKIDFDVLKHILGEEIEEGEEYYRFTWAGKAQARREAHKPSTGTLRPCPEESVDWENTENLYIEGDNLEVLKLLQKSYGGKIKMIYIDPPYNTGKDFVYKDNYKDNLRNYQELTGQVDSEGNKLSTNSDSDGRYHSNWLNMMYPRLRLARNLLTDDGVIFMSIDENEASNLIKISNEVFGETNFVSQAGWQKVYSPKNQARYLSNDYEFILIYAKNLLKFKIGLLPRTDKMNARYKNPDNDPRGNWKSGDLVAAGERSGGHYIVKNPNTGEEYDVPQGKHWAFSEPKMREMLAENRIYFGKDGKSFPSSKQFLSEVKQGRVASSFMSYNDYGHTDQAKKDFIRLFGDEGRVIFETLKPIKLVEMLMNLADLKVNDIILDFFAGSSTSAESVFRFNLNKLSSNRIIQVQLPQKTLNDSEAYKAGYKTIAEIGKERIRRAGKKIVEENPEKAKDLDFGFKVFKLDSSNIQSWDGDPENLEESLFKAQDNIKDDRSQEDVLFEILLKYGLDLTLPISTKTVDGKTIYNAGMGALFVCLDDGINSAISEEIATWHQEFFDKEDEKNKFSRVVFKDSGFASDMDKTNAMQTLKRHGITEVKSI